MDTVLNVLFTCHCSLAHLCTFPMFLSPVTQSEITLTVPVHLYLPSLSTNHCEGIVVSSEHCEVSFCSCCLSLSLRGPFSDCHSRSLLSGDQCEKNEQINKLNESIASTILIFKLPTTTAVAACASLKALFASFLSVCRERGMKANSECIEASSSRPVGANWCSHSVHQSLPDSTFTRFSSIAHSANLHVVWLLFGVTLPLMAPALASATVFGR